LLGALLTCIVIDVDKRVSIFIDHYTYSINEVAALTRRTPTLNSQKALGEDLRPSKYSLGDDEVWSQPSELLYEDKKVLGEGPVGSNSSLEIDVDTITFPLCDLRSNLQGLFSGSKCVFPSGDVLAVAVSSDRIHNFGTLGKLAASPSIFEGRRNLHVMIDESEEHNIELLDPRGHLGTPNVC
jgi:hypothetical protein